MAEEIQEAVQIIRVAYDGIEIAMKVGSGGINAMQKAIEFLKGMLDYEKSLGRTSMRKLLMKGGDLQVLQFKTNDMPKVEKMAKKYGILYSVLPDVNKKDGLSEIIFHTEAVPRANMMIQKIGFGSIASFDDYLKNGDEKSLGKLMEFLRGQKKGNEKVHTDDVERVNDIMDDGGGKPYEHERSNVDGIIGPPFQLLTEASLKYFEKLKANGENIYIDEITYEEFMLLGQAEMNKRFSDLDEAEQKARFNKEQGNELEYDEVSEIANKPVNREKYKIKGEDSFTARIAQWEFTDEQVEALELARQKGVPKHQLYKYFYPSVSAEEMRKIWNV